MNKKVVSLLLVMLMLLSLAACKTEEEPTITTFENLPGVVLVPEEMWEEWAEQETAGKETAPEESTAASEETAATEAPAETKENEEDSPDDVQVPTKPTEPAGSDSKVTEYEWFNALPGEEQEAYMQSFESIAAFFEWYNAAKAEYDELHPSIDVGDAYIDLGELIGGNG